MSFLYQKLIGDWIAIARRYGEDVLGLSFSKAIPGEEDIYLANRMSRIPSIRRRKVLVSDKFDCPPHLRGAWSLLRSKIEQGVDLFPHLSRQIFRVEATDGMLDAWGINHFHLGTEPDSRRESLVGGTSELVYASVVEGVFYAIAVKPHGHWNDHELVDTIGRYWPKHPSISTTMVMSRRFSPAESLELRANNVTVPTQLEDGRMFTSFGTALSGLSGLGMMRAVGLRGKIARETLRIAANSWAGAEEGDAALVALDDWSLHLDMPKIGIRKRLFAEGNDVGTIVDSLRRP